MLFQQDYPSFWVKPNHSFSWLSLLASWDGKKKKVFYSTKDKWWDFTLNHFLLLLNPKGWEEALQFIMAPVRGTIIFQGVAIRPAFQQLIKPAININSRQEFVTLLLIQSSGWLLWLALGYPFQGFSELGWDYWSSPWAGVMSCSLVLLDQGCPAGDFTNSNSAWVSGQSSFIEVVMISIMSSLFINKIFKIKCLKQNNPVVQPHQPQPLNKMDRIIQGEPSRSLDIIFFDFSLP